MKVEKAVSSFLIKDFRLLADFFILNVVSAYMSAFKIVKLLDSPVVISGNVTMTGGVALAASGNTTGTMATLSNGTAIFAGGSNITLSQSSNTITIIGGAGGGGSFSAGMSNLGNTLGSSGTVSNRIVFAGGNNITLSQSTNTNGATVTVSAFNQTVQTQNMVSLLGSTGDISFANGNGITFGGNASTITASHNGLTQQSTQPVAYSAGNGSANFSTLKFADSQGVSFSTGTQGVYATVKTDYQSSNANYLTQQSTQPVALSGSNGSFAFSTATFGNSNGLSFYTTNGSMVGSYTVPSVPSQTVQTMGIYGSSQTTGQSSSSTFDARSLTVRGAGNISVGMSGGEILISGTGGGGGIALYDGANSISTGTARFSNSNGVSFGFNGQTITASHNGLTSQSNQALSGANGSFTFQTATFANSNGISWSTGTQGMYATVKTDYLTQQTTQPVAVSGSNGSFNFSTLTMGNSNGLSFYTTNGSMVGSYTVPSVPSQTNQTIGIYASSNTTGQSSSSTYDARSLTFRGAGVASVGNSGGEIIISVPSGGGAGDGANILAAGTQTANTTGTVLFNNANGISFGMSDNSVITASHNGLTTAMASNAGSNFVYSSAGLNLTNISATLNSNSLSLSVANPPTQTQQPMYWSASGTSTSSNTIQFGNSNGVSFSLSNGSLVATVKTDYLTTAAQSNQVVNSVNGSTGQISFATGSSLSSSSNGSTITFGLASNITTALQSANANYLTSQSNQAFSASGGSSAFQTLNFANSNGITFSNSNGSVIASHNGLTTAMASNAGSNFVYSSAGLNLTNISATLNSNSLSLSVGNYITTAMASNAGSNFVAASAAFAGTNASGTIASNGISVSVAAPGAAAENNWFNLQGNTSNASTASGSTIMLSAGNNITLAASNGSIIKIEGAAGGGGGVAIAASNTTFTSGTVVMSAAGGALTIGSGAQTVNFSVPQTSSLVAGSGISISTTGSTISIIAPQATATMWYPYNEAVNVMGAQGNATWQFAPVPTPIDSGGGILSVDQAVFPMFVTNATNSTGTVTVSISMGLYTKNVSTLSLVHSASGSFAVTFSGTVNNSTYAGIRLATIPFNTTIEGGRYYAGVAYRSTTGGANATVSQVLVSQLNSNFSGLFGAASNRSYQWPLGLGVRSASSSGFFSSIAFSQIDGTASLAARPPSWHMRLGTA